MLSNLVLGNRLRQLSQPIESVQRFDVPESHPGTRGKRFNMNYETKTKNSFTKLEVCERFLCKFSNSEACSRTSKISSRTDGNSRSSSWTYSRADRQNHLATCNCLRLLPSAFLITKHTPKMAQPESKIVASLKACFVDIGFLFLLYLVKGLIYTVSIS